jgi:hypothetical protein
MIKATALLTLPIQAPEGFQHEIKGGATGPRADLISNDGRHRIEINYNLFSSRDLSAILLHLSLSIQKPADTIGWLLIVHPQMTSDRLKSEWNERKRLLHPELAARLRLLIVPREGVVDDDRTDEIQPVLDWLSRVRKPGDDRRHEVDIPRESFFRVLTTLVNLWMRRETPTSTLDLQRKTGLSYPTVVRALERMEARVEVDRTSDRRVGLARFPWASWQELVTLASGIRSTTSWSAPEGERVDLERLLGRVRKQLPQNAALGGVEAARHWSPDFDLNGIPRIDLTVQVVGKGPPNLDFLRKVDPSLRAATEGASARIVLAVHFLRRPESFFAVDPKDGTRFADPVETLLDLQELRLGEQAEALLRHLDPQRTA